MLCFRVAVMTLPLCFVFPFPIQLCNYYIYFCSEDDFTIISWLMVIITALLLSYVFPLLYWSTRSTWSPFFNGSSFSPTFIFPGSIYHCYFVCLISFDNCAVVLRRITASDWPFDIPHFFLMLYTPCPALHSNCVSQFPRRLYQYAMCYHTAVIL